MRTYFVFGLLVYSAIGCVVQTDTIEGPPGPQGLPGDAGEKGDTGDKGDPGDSHWSAVANGLYYAGGNVGIGEANPTHKLEISGVGNGQDATVALNFSDTAGAAYLAFLVPGGGGDIGVWGPDHASNPNTLQISTNGATGQSGTIVLATGDHQPVMTLTPSGNVGIGTPSPGNKLAVQGPNNSNPITVLNEAGADAIRLEVTQQGNGRLCLCVPGVACTVSLNSDVPSYIINDVGIGTASPASRLHVYDGCITGSFCSDSRLKNNIKPLDENQAMLEKVLAIEPVTFEWNYDTTGKTQLGLVAQQVESVLPEVVGPDSGENYQKGLSCTGLNAVLVQAIKEQDATIRTQRRQMETQQREIDELAARLARIEQGIAQ